MRIRPARLRYFRVSDGLTQEEVAKLAGISVSTYQQLEAGRRQTAWPKTLKLLCEVFGVTLEEIVWIDDDPDIHRIQISRREQQESEVEAS